jgi:CheY-like chemotaxis protein
MPNVVFLDIGLPNMNGYEVAIKLQAMPTMASSKLIALTGWGTAEDIRKSKNAGFYAHLTKPVDPDEVDALLAELAKHA